MMLMLIFVLITQMLFILLSIIIPIISLHKKCNREKNSPFECGFDPFSNSRMSFSIHFFSISLMFLIFDIEISVIFPTPIMKTMMKMSDWMLFLLMLMTLLLLGLFLEWKEGSMEWK